MKLLKLRTRKYSSIRCVFLDTMCFVFILYETRFWSSNREKKLKLSKKPNLQAYPHWVGTTKVAWVALWFSKTGESGNLKVEIFFNTHDGGTYGVWMALAPCKCHRKSPTEAYQDL